MTWAYGLAQSIILIVIGVMLGVLWMSHTINELIEEHEKKQAEFTFRLRAVMMMAKEEGLNIVRNDWWFD